MGSEPVVPLRLLSPPAEDAVPAAEEEPPDSLVLAETLQLVVHTIVDALGFGVAVLHLVDDDGSLYVAAAEAPEDLRDGLVGTRRSMASWLELLDASQPQGGLCFVDAAGPGLDDPQAWHPGDALLAPLQASDGSMLGILAVDRPADGRRPNAATTAALEAFGVTASLAIEHAALGERLRHSEHLFRAVFASSPVAIALFDDDQRLVAANPAYCAFMQRSEAQLLGIRVREITHPDDVSVTGETSTGERPGGRPLPLEKRYLRPDGTVVWGRVHLARLRGDHGQAEVVAQVEDISAQKEAEARLRHDAVHDPLTRLPNRTLILERLTMALADARATGRLVGVLFADLDRLKHVNDTHGHAVGDEYLRGVARRLEVSVRPRDTVGRLSGDEFVVVCPDLTTPSEVSGLADRLIDAVRQPLNVGAVTLAPSVSIGLSWSDGRDLSPEEVLAQADAALYQAKAAGRGGCQVYDQGLPARASQHLALRSRLPSALATGELELHHQSVVRLPDRTVVGREALLRWRHPELGLLLPSGFLDLVLDSDLEGAVTDWALLRACTEAAARDDECWVSVNVSPLQILREDLPAVVAGVLDASGLPSDRLVLEVPEDRLLAGADAPRHLASVQALGVRVALGGFGTGYAGLGALLALPLDVLKADRRFTAGLPDDPVSCAVVRSVLDLAASRRLDAVVEGVETEAQAAALCGLGVVHAQGYLFGGPGPA
ncbi:MAG: phosphodiesterase [Frankiales bacterium]|nr:phosphodiesterase [Frankiales bacterium]